MNETLTMVTDSAAKPTRDFDHPSDQPNPGSIVLTNGEFGTAWQRYFNDGLWHRVGGGKGRTWEWLLTQRNLVLVYDAPFRSE